MPNAVDRINQAVDEPYAAEHLDTYFYEMGHIEGLPGSPAPGSSGWAIRSPTTLSGSPDPTSRP